MAPPRLALALVVAAALHSLALAGDPADDLAAVDDAACLAAVEGQVASLGGAGAVPPPERADLRRELERIAAASPTGAALARQARWRLVELLGAWGDHDGVVAQHRVLAKIEPGAQRRREVLWRCACLLRGLGRLEEAIAACRELLAIDANVEADVWNGHLRPQAARALAELCLAAGKPEEAVEAAKAARGRFSSPGVGCGNMFAMLEWEDALLVGRCCAAAGRTDEALAVYWEKIVGDGLHSSHDIPVAYADLYVEAGKGTIADLCARAQAAPRYGPVRELVAYLPTLDAYRRRAAGDLYEIARHGGTADSGGLANVAVAKLATLGEAAGGAVVERLATGAPRSFQVHIGEYRWAIYFASFVTDDRVVKAIIAACPEPGSPRHREVVALLGAFGDRASRVLAEEAASNDPATAARAKALAKAVPEWLQLDVWSRWGQR